MTKNPDHLRDKDAPRQAAHTPEPWQIEYDRNDQANIYGATLDEWVAICPHQGVTELEIIADRNSDRIVACVNALAGIQNPAAISQLVEAARNMANAWPFHYVDEIGEFVCPITSALRQLRTLPVLRAYQRSTPTHKIKI